jgi:ATP-dependent DNA ligase
MLSLQFSPASDDDLRWLRLMERTRRLGKMLERRPEGIHAAPYEIGAIGSELFPHACLTGLEGIVSKHIERAYNVGRCSHWKKIKNKNHPAYSRVASTSATIALPPLAPRLLVFKRLA